ncbi:MAG TPA: TraB domain-containing protein [Candidatus Nanoarchaeia archaeon]|nr:TraB domain-containing protein [Candidatus Nanoarchaeia archaeon]
MKYGNLTIIGSSHIARESMNEVKGFIEKEKPDIVAIELDKHRASALLAKKKSKIRLRDIRKIGVKGYIFSLIGAWAEKKLGEHVGVAPGSEMKTALKLAMKHNLKIAFIDQDIAITLRRFSNALTWKEKWTFLKDIFRGLVLRKREVEFDLRKVPPKEVIKILVDKVRKDYPNVYRVLITERDKVMAANLENLMKKYPDKKILAVVGAGHEEGIMENLKPRGGFSYSFSVE